MQKKAQNALNSTLDIPHRVTDVCKLINMHILCEDTDVDT